MGYATGRWNTEKTEYDVMIFSDHTKIHRLENFEAWALLNQQLYGWKMVMSPDGIVYCTVACAIIDNPEQGWTRDDLEVISTPEFWTLRTGAGINPWRSDLCPHCSLPYLHNDVDYWKGVTKKHQIEHRLRMLRYIANRADTGEE
jgi:hypothetical protein